jgi:tetratricopeptide (TPR) repeat protein
VIAALIFFWAAVCATLAVVQVGSDALFSEAAAPGSLPARVPVRAGERIYRAILRIAPAPYALAMLAQDAYRRGDLPAASTYASRLPRSPQRWDIFGRIALARGDTQTAIEDFLRAGDVEAIGERVDALAPQNPSAAYNLESQLERRLARSRIHPDAVAEAYWRMGTLSARMHHPGTALAQYRRAVALAPLDSKYLLALGYQAYALHRDGQARRVFERAIEVDPTDRNARAGLRLTSVP